MKSPAVLLNATERDIRRAEKWAATFIREHIDHEGKFVADAPYELLGKNLREDLAVAYLKGQGFGEQGPALPDLVERLTKYAGEVMFQLRAHGAEALPTLLAEGGPGLKLRQAIEDATRSGFGKGRGR